MSGSITKNWAQNLGVKVGNQIPTFYGQDRWKTFVYEQKGLEIVKKRDFGVKN